MSNGSEIPGASTELERQHAARVEAQIAVRSLQHEAAKSYKLLEEQKVLYDDVVDLLEAAQRRLCERKPEYMIRFPGHRGHRDCRPGRNDAQG